VHYTVVFFLTSSGSSHFGNFGKIVIAKTRTLHVGAK